MRLVTAIVALSTLANICQSDERIAELSFSAQLNQNGSLLKLSWANSGSSSVLVTLGSIAGGHLLLSNTTKLYISGPGLRSGNLLYSEEPAGIGGRIEPLVVCLPTGAEYGLQLETRRLVLPGYEQTLANLHNRKWKIVISFIGRPAFRLGPPGGKLVPYDGVSEYGIKLNYWTGTSKVAIEN
jgi:hypothetical protein